MIWVQDLAVNCRISSTYFVYILRTRITISILFYSMLNINQKLTENVHPVLYNTIYFSLFQNSSGDPVYRKVAVVENFFDIIYNVHVDLEGRPGKHAGQKRTYRTVCRKTLKQFFYQIL